jgi:hypothetical protein
MAGLTTRLANEPHRLPAPQQRQTNGNAVGLGVQRAGMRRWAERSEHAIVHWIEDLARQVHGAPGLRRALENRRRCFGVIARSTVVPEHAVVPTEVVGVRRWSTKTLFPK